MPGVVRACTTGSYVRAARNGSTMFVPRPHGHAIATPFDKLAVALVQKLAVALR